MATASPYNRGYTGGIAARGAMPVGRGAYDLNRAAEQTFRRTGSPAALMAMDWRNQMAQRRMPMMLPPTGGMPNGEGQSTNDALPVMPAPQGTWTPGFNGSQIFVPASAPTVPQPPQAMPAMPPPPMGGMTNGEGRMTNAALPAPPPLAFPFPALPATGGALPPSTLGGQPGTPPPPAFFNQQVGGWDVLGANTAQGPKFMNARPVEAPAPPPLSMPELGRLTAAGYEPFQVNGQSFDANGVPYIRKIEQPLETVRTNSLTGEQVTTRKQPAGSAPAPAVLPPLTAPAAASATAPGGMRGTTKGGYTWTLK